MKHLLVILFLFCGCISTQAAVTLSSRGTGGNNSAATSVTITPASNSAVGSTLVLVIACDNANGNGSTPTTPSTETDSVGNVYTRRINPIYDPGAAGAGVETAYYTAPVTVAFTTGNNLVFDFADSVTAKSWTLLEVVPTSGKVMQYVTGAAGTGAASATPTVTTSSVTSGDVVIGGGGSESTLTWTGDADTSNGSWTNEQEIGNGTGTSGMAVTSQAKLTTGTATQTYNPTQTSADQILGWIQLREVSAATSSFFLLFP